MSMAQDITARTGSLRSASAYPLARWYLRPWATLLARRLAATALRPWHMTVCGLLTALAAGLVLLWGPSCAPLSGALVLLAWFFDRADGQLARHQGTISAWGAWLDANVDELIDVGLHVATAAAAAHWTGSAWPWTLLLGFVAGKYLFMHGLMTEDAAGPGPDDDVPAIARKRLTRWLRHAYHLPANADVRVHMLALALLSGWLTAELWLIAVYYNVRWAARIFLVSHRLRGHRP